MILQNWTLVANVTVQGAKGGDRFFCAVGDACELRLAEAAEPFWLRDLHTLCKTI